MSKDLADKAESLGLTRPDGVVWREKYEQLEKVCDELTKQFNSNKYYRKEPSFQDGLYFPHTTRFEVIDDEGRTYVKYDCEVKLVFQDDGQTIKMFVSKNTEDRKNS